MKQKCYKKEKIRPLKTPRQVRQWIKRQAWYSSFRMMVWMEEDRTLRDRLRTLGGYDGAMTITDAFDWGKTVQGFRHWSVVNDVFKEWFNSK